MAIWRGAFLALFVGAGFIILATAQSAFVSTFYTGNFPDALAVKLALWPLVFPVHMFTGGLALLLVPLAMSLRATRWHKWVGRVAAADVFLAAATAIPVALAYPVTRWAAAGFCAQALFWLLFLALGIRHIRHRRVSAHRNMMLLMVAVTSGAIFFRIFLYLWKAYGQDIPFHAFYSVNAWIAWALPLFAMQTFLHHKKHPFKSSRLSSIPQTFVILGRRPEDPDFLPPRQVWIVGTVPDDDEKKRVLR